MITRPTSGQVNIGGRPTVAASKLSASERATVIGLIDVGHCHAYSNHASDGDRTRCTSRITDNPPIDVFLKYNYTYNDWGAVV